MLPVINRSIARPRRTLGLPGRTNNHALHWYATANKWSKLADNAASITEVNLNGRIARERVAYAQDCLNYRGL